MDKSRKKPKHKFGFYFLDNVWIVEVEVVDIGEQTCNDGSKLPLPPILLGRLGRDPAKKTLLVYGHLDVQPALVEDGWNTDPFKLIEKDGKLWGRGSTDDKGPVLGWVNAIEAYQSCGKAQFKFTFHVNFWLLPVYSDFVEPVVKDLPINIKFCLEAMEESGSVMLEETVRSRNDFFATEVDWVCISDNYFLGKTKPCLTYG